eukprot:1158485-Pelagomonas_calceolata.AAC.3
MDKVVQRVFERAAQKWVVQCVILPALGSPANVDPYQGLKGRKGYARLSQAEKKGGIVRYRTPEAASEALSGFNARPEAERSIGGVKADLKMVEGKEEQEFYERRALLQATNSSGTEAWVHPRLCVAAAAVSSASYPQIVEACCSNPASSCSSGRSGPWSWEWQGATATTQDEEGEAEEEGEAVEETEGGAEEVDGEVGVAEAAEVAEEGVKKIIGEQALAGWDGTVHGFGGGMAQSFNLWPGFEHAFW